MQFSGNKFRSLRKSKKITMTEIANGVGVSQSAISHWESGKNSPTDQALQRAAEILGCNVEDFQASEDEISNRIRAILRDDDGRIKHETRFDSNGNTYRDHSPLLW